MLRVMLDIETFSRQPDAAVFEVALVPFDDAGPVSTRVVPFLTPRGELTNESLGHCWTWVPETGHFEGETVAWWMRQGGRRDLVTPAGYSEERIASEIRDVLAQCAEAELWANHTSFDCVILQQLLARYGHQMPIGFRQWMDLPTLRAAAGNPHVPRMGQRHLATDDCMQQIAVWGESCRVLGLNRECPSTIPDRTRLASVEEFEAASASLARGAPGPQICEVLTDNQVAYLEEKRGSSVWTAADFNLVLRGLRG